MNFGELLNECRSQMRPKGTADVVILRPTGHYGFLECKTAELQDAIDIIERIPGRIAMGDEPNALEKLGMRFLFESTYGYKEGFR